MDKAELLEKLKAILSPYAQDKEALERINEDTDFIAGLKMNSANLVDIVMDIEEEFNIEIDNASMEKMRTVEAALAVISAKI